MLTICILHAFVLLYDTIADNHVFNGYIGVNMGRVQFSLFIVLVQFGMS